MSSDYLLGKDIATLMESLRRVEGRMEALERSRCNCQHREQPEMPTIAEVPSILLPSEQSRESVRDSLAVSIGERLADPRPGKHSSPDGLQEFVFLAFTVRGQSSPDDPAFWNIVWEEGRRLCNENKSVSMDEVDVTRVNELCLFGYFNCTTGYANWITVWPGLIYSNGSCCASSTNHPNGQFFRKEGFDPDVVWKSSNKYLITIRYADNDRRGIIFKFQPIGMV